MTRETKIGLLVALVFVIVIGILLSDYHRGSQEPPVAVLDHAGATARQAVSAPGTNVPAGPVIVPTTVTPGGAVQTPGDIEPPAGPVVVSHGEQTGNAGLPANDPLVQEAKKQGEEIVPADQHSQAGPSADISGDSYVARPGDTVSRIAARVMGGNTSRNRKALIAANPSLQQNPDKVVAGQEYVIPGHRVSTADASTVGAAMASGRMEPVGEGSPGTAAPTNGGMKWVYTVKSGDTLWAIANRQLGNAGQMEAIARLNQDVLHGDSTLQPGMKLRLPSPPVAVAN